jgi:PD-(D/E)XK nuclease superfamily
VPPGQADAFRAAAEAAQHLLGTTRVAPTPARVEPPRILSVSQVLTYARCPRDFYWSVVRPLPSAPKPAARLGTVVHRRLERRARSLPDLLDSDDLDGDRPGGLAAPELIERATRNFAATRYADLPPTDAEVGVVLRVGAWVVRGRIDAIFRLPPGDLPDVGSPGGADSTGAGQAERTGPAWTGEADGATPTGAQVGGTGSPGTGRPGAGQGEQDEHPTVVEVVDWKTGRQGDQGTGELDQLAIYALALRALGELPGDRCVVTYCYLGGERPVTETRVLGPADLDRQQALLEATLDALGKDDYRRTCGRADCETCRRALGAPPRRTAGPPSPAPAG